MTVESDPKECKFPDWLSRHHNWRSVDNIVSIHINKNVHSLKMRRRRPIGDSEEVQETHVTCHGHVRDATDEAIAKLVVHVKSGW